MRTTASYADIAASKYVSLKTFRKNGDPVITPVWVAPSDDGKGLYMFTAISAGKVWRIRNNPAVELARCTYKGVVRGSSVSGRATLLPPSRYSVADRALTRKYPVAKRLLGFINRLVGGRGKYAYIRIVLGVDASAAGELAS